MQSFLWAIGSLLILVPIIYFLPLGITLRGKWLVIIISFILGLTGLLAKTIFPLWKTILMLLLLMGIVVYFIEKKLGTVLFLPETPNSVDNKEEIEDWEMSEKQVEKFSTKEDLEVLPVNDFESNKDDFFIEPSFEQAIPIAEPSLEKETEPMDDLEEDITFIQDRNQILEVKDDVIEEIDLTPQEETYEAEYEELMNQPLDCVSNESKSEDIQTDIGTETISDYFNSLVEEDNLEKEELPATDLDQVYMNLNQERLAVEVAESESEDDSEYGYEEANEHLADSMVDLNSSVEPNLIKTPIQSNPIEEAMPEGTSEIEEEFVDEEQLLEEFLENMPKPINSLDEVVEIEEDFIDQVDQDEETFIGNFLDEDVNIEETPVIGITDPEEQKDNNIDQGVLHKELLNTMVSHLQIISNKVDPQEYEELIKEHMHEQLPVHDYYTFASLLIRHYIRMNKYEELEWLISSISSKVKGYAILEQELEYIYNHYCGKNR